MKEVRTLYVDHGEEGVRLDRWFKRRWPHLNHIQIQKLTRSGQIRVDGARAKPDTRLSAGSQVRVPPLPDAPPPREKGQIDPREAAYARSLVIYEDEEVLALNKPAGLAVQGGTKTSKHVDRLLSAWGEGTQRPKLVLAFAKRKARKVYWAIVAGFPKPGEGVIDLPLIKKGVGDREMVVPAEPGEERAEAAETEFVTVTRAGPRAAWMALWPHTGRTHQLRAHMLAMGHPILGDPKYNTELSRELSGGLKLQLHARRLVLPHPSRGMLALEAPISPELEAGFARFGFDVHEADPDPFAGRKGR
jgi:23S rRNA pseudouridine955/2504/2580 synthase